MKRSIDRSINPPCGEPIGRFGLRRSVPHRASTPALRRRFHGYVYRVSRQAMFDIQSRDTSTHDARPSDYRESRRTQQTAPMRLDRSIRPAHRRVAEVHEFAQIARAAMRTGDTHPKLNADWAVRPRRARRSRPGMKPIKAIGRRDRMRFIVCDQMGEAPTGSGRGLEARRNTSRR